MNTARLWVLSTIENLTFLRDAAEAICRDSAAAVELGISSLDLVRDVLLNVGGVAHLPVRPEEKEKLCKQAFGRISLRRRDLPTGFLGNNRAFDLRNTELSEINMGNRCQVCIVAD